MKIKDYFRLSRISLKSRKKSTKSTVRGISFGLILLLPLLFLVIAFYVDLNKEVNKDVAFRVFNIHYISETTNENQVESILEDYNDEINNIEGVVSSYKYNYFSFKNSEIFNGEKINYKSSVKIGDKVLTLDYQKANQNIDSFENDYIGLTVIDDKNKQLFTNYDYAVLGGEEPLIAGTTFSSNSSKELMVSSNFLAHYNLEVSDVLNKTISMSYILNHNDTVTSSSVGIDSESIAKYSNIPVIIFMDFKIVGVYNSKIYQSTARHLTMASTYSSKLEEPYFWVTSSSLYDNSNQVYMPKGIYFEEDDYKTQAYYYNKDLISMANEAKNNNCVFLPLGLGVSTLRVNSLVPTYNELVEFDSYKSANNATKIIDNYLTKTSTSLEEIDASNNYQNDFFANYQMFYNVFTYVCIILAVFGGVIFFATLLNLYNSIHYSVQSRKNYIGMMRAIGMKSKEVVSLYFVEVFEIFTRSYIWTGIFGGIICFGITYVFQLIMASEYASLITIKLNLNPIYILISFAVLVIFNLIISIIFALIACHSVSKKPVLDVLNENR